MLNLFPNSNEGVLQAPLILERVQLAKDLVKLNNLRLALDSNIVTVPNVDRARLELLTSDDYGKAEQVSGSAPGEKRVEKMGRTYQR